MNFPGAAVALLAAAFGFSAPAARAEAGNAARPARGASIDARGDSPARGEIVFAAGNCTSCHTDLKNKGPLLAGGGAPETPF